MAIRYRYSGQLVPRMQQRLGDHGRAVRIEADRLAAAAQDLQEVANDAGLPRTAKIARRHQALAAEARRVAAPNRPGAELAQVDWVRVDGIADGVRRLQVIDGAEQREEMRQVLRGHEQYRRDMIEAGMRDYVTERVDADPAMQRALQQMHEFAGD
ncbi:hypothetical protein [Stenotrophomonas humi]